MSRGICRHSGSQKFKSGINFFFFHWLFTVLVDLFSSLCLALLRYFVKRHPLACELFSVKNIFRQHDNRSITYSKHHGCRNNYIFVCFGDVCSSKMPTNISKQSLRLPGTPLKGYQLHRLCVLLCNILIPANWQGSALHEFAYLWPISQGLSNTPSCSVSQ